MLCTRRCIYYKKRLLDVIGTIQRSIRTPSECLHKAHGTCVRLSVIHQIVKKKVRERAWSSQADCS